MNRLHSPREMPTDANGKGPVASAFRRRPADRAGAVLVEFALVAFVFYLLLAATFEMGHMIVADQILNSAARVGARELSVLPLPAEMTFDQAMNDPVDVTQTGTNPIMAAASEVHESVYDRGRLVIDVTGKTDAQVQQILDSLPALNKALAPLMVREHVNVGGSELDLVRYPGALVRNPYYHAAPYFEDNPYDVMIPRVSTDSSGHESITWLPVVEEIRPDPNDPLTGPFSIASTTTQGPRCTVALRINYPFQASMLSGYVDGSASGGGVNTPIEADDSSVSDPGGVQAVAHESNQTSISGTYGLGKLYALGKEVRPYRRLLSAQCIAPRERLGR